MAESTGITGDVKNTILREQVLLVFRQLPTMQATSFIVALVLAYAVRNIVPATRLISWILLVLFVVIGRIFLYRRFLRVRDGSFDSGYWKNAYLLLALISGIVWGISAFIIFPTSHLTYISLFVLVIASLSAATTISHSSIKWAPAAWAVPAMLLYSVRCFIEGGETEYTIGFLVILYLFTILRYSLNQNKAIISFIALKLENLKLLEAVAELKYRTLFEQSPDGILIMDTQGRILDFNSNAHLQLGYTREEFARLRVSDIEQEESHENLERKISDLVTKGRSEYEAKHKTRDSQMRDVQVIVQKLVLSGDTVLHTIWRDVTERKRAEEELRKSKESVEASKAQYEQVVSMISDTVWSYEVTPQGQFVASYISPVLDRILCLPYSTIKNSFDMFFSHVHPEDLGRVRETLLKGILSLSQNVSEEYRLIASDGRILWVRSTGSAYVQPNGNITAFGTTSDITDSKQAEQERLKTQKLEAIGTLAGGIAHDFNNLLQGVFSYISLARLTIGSRDQSLAALEKAEKALHMSIKLTGQLLTFSKGGKPHKKPVDLAPLIENVVSFTLSGSNSDYTLDCEKDLWQIEADDGQIAQVIQNIVLNADQAMPEGGRVEITARNMRNSDIDLTRDLQKEKYVQIAIKDSGIGIAEKHIGKIFDPYFTTKEKGSGLGLAASYSIVKNHDGLIDVRSEVGRGTTFVIYLPAVTNAQDADSLAAQVPAISGRTCRILLMDDEEIISEGAGELMRALGHEVDVASYGEEAIEKYLKAMQSGRPFDIVILDLTIRGGMGGAETLRKLLESDPGVRGIVSSGYSDDIATSNYLAQGFKAFLKKPYNVEELQEALTAILSKPD